MQIYNYNQKPVSVFLKKPTSFLCKRLHQTTSYFLLYKVFSNEKRTTNERQDGIRPPKKHKNRPRKSLESIFILQHFFTVCTIFASYGMLHSDAQRQRRLTFSVRLAFKLFVLVWVLVWVLSVSLYPISIYRFFNSCCSPNIKLRKNLTRKDLFGSTPFDGLR